MKLKPLVILVGGLGIASAAVYFLNRPPAEAPADARLGQPVLSADIADKAAGLRLQQNGQTVELRKRPDGAWIVPSYHDLEADFSRLSQLTDSLASAKWKRFVTGSAERLKRLDLDSLSVALLDEKGAATWTLQVGKSFEGGGRFARLGDEPKAFVADLNVWVDTEAKNWADSALLKVKPEEVKEIAVGFAGEPELVLSRASAEADFTAAGLPEGKIVKKSQATSALSTLTGLRFSQTYDPTDAKAGAAAPHARSFRLKTFADQEWTITLAQAPAAPTPPPAQAQPGATPTPPPPPAPENPVFVTVKSPVADAPINNAMSRRSFEVYAYALANLPKDKVAWLDNAPAPTPVPTPLPAPAK